MNSFLESMFGLSGKRALVTGCRRGIGRAMAVALAQAGADIVGISASLESSDSAVQREVEALGRQFRGYACNLADRSALYRLLEQLNQEFPTIDILICNAGIIRRSAAAEHTDEDWDQVIQTNLSSTFILSREIGKRMLARGQGKIIFVASLLSFQGGITVPGYAASKGGVAQLAKALANEWAPKGVNVNAIAPGYIETDNTVPLRQDAARAAAILGRVPAGRWGVPADLQGVTIFLASAASDYLHGSIVTVDGGWMGR